MNKGAALVLGLFALMPACSTDQMAVDRERIEAYLEKNGLQATRGDEGVYYYIEVEGSGAHPGPQSTVTVHYKGKDLQGKVFDSSYERGSPSTFALTQVIQGWQIGMQYFKEGGKGTLYIPSELAYGENPPRGSGIDKNAVLIFDIELLKVK